MSSMLASDDINPQFVGARNPDDVLTVGFRKVAVQDIFKTSVQNRPIFNDVVYITIITPGIPELNRIDRPMREADKVRFARQWMQYQAVQSGTPQEQTSGTPLNQWPFLTLAQGEELKGAKFYTVESIANASDQQIGSLGMVAGTSPLVLRERARGFLAAAGGSANTEHLAAELAKRDQQLAAMQEQIAALMEAQNKPAPAVEEPGRPILKKPEKGA